MDGIRKSQVLSLQLVVTGMHLSPEFGFTYRAIEEDGFAIDKRIEMLLSSDTSVGITKSLSLAVSGFADALAELKPDLLLVLGDRYELLAAVAAALFARIPVAHLHGGELTEGAFDDAIRHSISKMSHLHFVATEEYRKRVIQLGESPESVFLVGGLGIDNILKLELLSRDALEKALDFRLGERNILVTYHPVTLDQVGSAKAQMSELLAALDSQAGAHILFTMPNSDTDSRVLFEMINNFVSAHPKTSIAFTSLGQLRYLSCIRHFDCVVGNSSSGIIEAPSLRKGTINIGDRQRGRLKANSVIDCAPIKNEIMKALEYLYSDDFQARLGEVKNPYGNGGASDMIVSILEKVAPSNLLKKCFYDLPSLSVGK